MFFRSPKEPKDCTKKLQRSDQYPRSINSEQTPFIRIVPAMPRQKPCDMLARKYNFIGKYNFKKVDFKAQNAVRGRSFYLARFLYRRFPKSKKVVKITTFLLQFLFWCATIILFHSGSGAFIEQRRYLLMKQLTVDLCKAAGENLKRAIKESKWKTQERFSEAFGASARAVGRWCNVGIDKLSLVHQIATFLEIDVFTLLFP